MAYTPLLRPWSKRPKSQMFAYKNKRDALLPNIQANVPIPIWLCLGAAIQSLFLFLPLSSIIKYWRFYAVLPAVLYLASRAILTTLIMYKFIPNPYLRGSIHGRHTALVPDLDGNLPDENGKPNENKVAVLVLAARFNHPLGPFFSPESDGFFRVADPMFGELERLPQDESGFLGQTSLRGTSSEGGTVETFVISYWRSIEHIHRYAASPKHVDAINWWNNIERQDRDKLRHIGIMHEIYEAPAGCWESIYLNFQPTMLGATTYLKRNDGTKEAGVVSQEWLSPLVDASRGKLRSSRGRLGWDARGDFRQVHEKEGQVNDY